MRAVFKIFGRFFLGLAGLSLWLSPASSQSFKEALAKAYSTNPTLAAARAQLRATDEGVSQALGGFRPSITASYEAGKDWRDLSGDSVSGSRNRNLTPRTAKASIVQKIYDGGQREAGLEGAEADVLAQRARLLSAEQTILFNAAKAYIDVYRDQAVLKLNQNNETVLKRQFEATKDRFEVGEVTRTDVSLAEARYTGSVADRISAEGLLANSRAAYKNAIGDLPRRLEKVTPLSNMPVSQEVAIEIAKKNNPSIITARHKERSAKAAVKKSSGAFLPTITVEGGLSRSEEASSRDTRTDSAEIFATIKIPLYQKGVASSETRESKYILGQRRFELDVAIRKVLEDTSRAWESLVTSKARISALEAEIRASTIALEGVRQEAQVGSRTILDVLDAEQDLLNARVKLVRAEQSEVLASMDLKRSLGSLTASSLNLPVKVYNPIQAYEQTKKRFWGKSVD